MLSKKKYLTNLYYIGQSSKDPNLLPSWFSFLLENGYVKIMTKRDLVVITEKGLDYVESLGFIKEFEVQAKACMHY
jgi:predicted transcriptional regulator